MAGRLRHRVTVERQATTQDELGQTSDTWTTVDTVWARIRPLSGEEKYVGSGEYAAHTHEFLMRHGATVATKDRLLYDGRYFDVESIANWHERDSWLLVMAREDV